MCIPWQKKILGLNLEKNIPLTMCLPTRVTHNTVTLIANIYIRADIILHDMSDHQSFVEKTSVKQDPKPQVCSNFQMSFLHLSKTDPLVEASQVSLTLGQPLGQADLQSDISPVEASSGQEWYYIKVSLTFGQPLGQADLHSDVSPK